MPAMPTRMYTTFSAVVPDPRSWLTMFRLNPPIMPQFSAPTTTKSPATLQTGQQHEFFKDTPIGLRPTFT